MVAPGPGEGGRVARRDLHGILLLDKPAGMTSNAALQRVKWLYRARKAGHTGSLDPLATGMLPICFGEATKVSAFLLGADKRYRVEVIFGIGTDTGDADGKVVQTAPVPAMDATQIRAVLLQMTGEIEQVPPMYSALKQGGRRLYEIARAGGEVPRPPRPVRIHAFHLDHHDAQSATFTVSCSKGTYVRTLVEDLSVALGTVGHVVALRRLDVSPFSDQAMVTLGEIEAMAEAGPHGLDALLLPLDAALAGWPALVLSAADAFRAGQGQAVAVATAPAGLVRLYAPGPVFIGMGEVDDDGRMQPRRLLTARPGAGYR